MANVGEQRGLKYHCSPFNNSGVMPYVCGVRPTVDQFPCKDKEITEDDQLMCGLDGLLCRTYVEVVRKITTMSSQEEAVEDE